MRCNHLSKHSKEIPSILCSGRDRRQILTPPAAAFGLWCFESDLTVIQVPNEKISFGKNGVHPLIWAPETCQIQAEETLKPPWRSVGARHLTNAAWTISHIVGLMEIGSRSFQWRVNDHNGLVSPVSARCLIIHFLGFFQTFTSHRTASTTWGTDSGR